MVAMNENKVFRKVYSKFIILRVRAKISWMAFRKNMTIIELFAKTILKCHKELRDQELLDSGRKPANEDAEEKVFKKLLLGEQKGFFRAIVKFNNQKIRDPGVA